MDIEFQSLQMYDLTPRIFPEIVQRCPKHVSECSDHREKELSPLQATLPARQRRGAFQDKPLSLRGEQLEATVLDPCKCYLYSFKVQQINPHK